MANLAATLEVGSKERMALIDTCFEELWRRHPRQERRRGAFEAFVRVKGVDRFGEIKAGHARWCASETWQAGMVMYLDRWLMEGCWEDEPRPATEKNDGPRAAVPGGAGDLSGFEDE